MFEILIILPILCGAHPSNVAWYGGPVQIECEHALNLLTASGQYVKENVIATKAVSFNDDVYVISPRMKHGVLATVWQLARGRRGPELEPYPALSSHTLNDCGSIQNAVDVHLDYIERCSQEAHPICFRPPGGPFSRVVSLTRRQSASLTSNGNLWVLDSGIVDTLEAPRCTCKPKVVVISTLLRAVTKLLDLSALAEPSSLLQNVAVDYGLGGKPFVYVSDATRGAILVRDASSNAEWSVLVCPPAAGLQMTLVKRSPTHTILMAARPHHAGLMEIDSAALRRRNSALPLRVFGDHTKPVFLLGSDSHHIYLRYADGTDVLSWDVREGYNMSRLLSIHSPGPRLIPTSVSVDPLKHALLVLDSNYGDVIHTNLPAYQRISFIGQL